MSKDTADRSTLRAVADGKYYVVKIRCLECGRTHTTYGDPKVGFYRVLKCSPCGRKTLHVHSDYSISRLYHLMENVGGVLEEDYTHVRARNVVKYLKQENLTWPEY